MRNQALWRVCVRDLKTCRAFASESCALNAVNDRVCDPVPLPSIYVFLPPFSFLLSSLVPLIVFGLLLFVLLAFAGVVLLSLALRYRAGTARRLARPWVTSLNVWATSFSMVFFLFFTGLLSFWIDSAFRFGLIGMACGAVLGVLGLALTRWERRREGLFYTPNRWLAVVVTLAIAGRFIYGWWRATHPGSTAPGDQHWLITASGTQLSLAVGAGLIGYYLVHAIGVRLQLARHHRGSESTVIVLTNGYEQRQSDQQKRSALLNSSVLILAWRIFRYVLRHWRK